MKIVNDYNPNLPLDRAWTIPASWYIDKELYEDEL